MKDPHKSRREFLKKSSVAALTSSMGFNVLSAKPKSFKNLNNDTLKVGLIGCGGRGTGAAYQASMADPNVMITAMADVFQDRLDKSYENLKMENPDKLAVDEDHKFIGFDSYKKVIESDVDVVILATPPNFRPGHLEACVAAGKHVFTEKPVAVDAPGIRRVMESAKQAKEKGLAMMSGFCWRHDIPKIDTFSKLADGAIGDIHTIYNTYNTGALWFHERKPDWSDFEFELRNWLYYNWMSGDHIIEQAIHSIDLMSWAMGDQLPVKAIGTGGRQSRTEPEFGNIFDHFAVVYEYADGKKGYHFSRQQKDCARSYHLDIMGTEGRCFIDVFRKHEITGRDSWKWDEITGKDRWTWDGEKSNMYQNEHDTLFASIRKGEPFNDGIRMANSTMLGIWGRMVAYTGQSLTWEEALNSQEVLGPEVEEFTWDLDWPLQAVAKPGLTKFT